MGLDLIYTRTCNGYQTGHDIVLALTMYDKCILIRGRRRLHTVRMRVSSSCQFHLSPFLFQWNSSHCVFSFPSTYYELEYNFVCDYTRTFLEHENALPNHIGRAYQYQCSSPYFRKNYCRVRRQKKKDQIQRNTSRTKFTRLAQPYPWHT